MLRKVQSDNPEIAKIAGQGLALRQAGFNRVSNCTPLTSRRNSKDSSCDSASSTASSASSFASSLLLGGYFTFSPANQRKRAISRRLTAETEPETDETIEQLLADVRKHQAKNATSFGKKYRGEHQNARSGPETARLEMPNHRVHRSSRIHGCKKDQRNGEDLTVRPRADGPVVTTFQQAPLAIQRRLVEEDLKPNFYMHFPAWKPFSLNGKKEHGAHAGVPGNHITKLISTHVRASTDTTNSDGAGVHLEGCNRIEYHNVPLQKYTDIVTRKLGTPLHQERVDGVVFMRGFPLNPERKMKAAESVLTRLSFEASCILDPFGRLSNYRLVHHHFIRADQLTGVHPDQYTLENTYPVPDLEPYPRNPQSIIPFTNNVAFRNPAEPDYIIRPARHPGIENSDLEALQGRNEKPLLDGNSMRAVAYHAKTQAVAIQTTRPRPGMIRRLSDRAAKTRKGSILLGNKGSKPQKKRPSDDERSQRACREAQSIAPADSGRELQFIQPEPPLSRAKRAQPQSNGVPRQIESNVYLTSLRAEGHFRPQMVQNTSQFVMKDPKSIEQADKPPSPSGSYNADSPPADILCVPWSATAIQEDKARNPRNGCQTNSLSRRLGDPKEQENVSHAGPQKPPKRNVHWSQDLQRRSNKEYPAHDPSRPIPAIGVRSPNGTPLPECTSSNLCLTQDPSHHISALGNHLNNDIQVAGPMPPMTAPATPEIITGAVLSKKCSRYTASDIICTAM